MKTSAAWLDAIKRQHKVSSDYAVAKLLGLAPTVVGHYRCGRRVMDNYACFKTAELLGIEPAKVIASAEAERARTADKKDFWKRLAAGVLMAVGAGAVTLPAPPAQAAGSLHNQNVQPDNTHSALKGRRRRQAAAQAISALAQAILPLPRNRTA